VQKRCRSEQDTPVWLSVVVIGRNEGKTLPALFQSLPAAGDIEWIYVDSLSTDDSIGIGLKHGAKVYSLEADPSLCPASGRCAGTLEAAGRWILYLDGDMVLQKEFIAFLDYLKKEEANMPAQTAGFVGKTCSRFIDQGGLVVSSRDNVCIPARFSGKKGPWGRTADYHGGAVLYLRKAVLQAGNWNPAVSQLEEIDLYSRIRSLGLHVRALSLPMADHFTPLLPLKNKLQAVLLPWHERRTYLGANQLLVSRWRHKNLGSLIRFYPGPFLVFGGLIFSLPGFFIWKPLPLIINGALALYFAVKKKWYFYLVHLGTVIQAFCGWGGYRPFDLSYRQVKGAAGNSDS
jgi:glycosyltransferase involved in cell wall biosynthesis